jgi:hypothetical protein
MTVNGTIYIPRGVGAPTWETPAIIPVIYLNIVMNAKRPLQNFPKKVNDTP